MIARGDLGVEIPAHEVPAVQKYLINKCRMLGSAASISGANVVLNTAVAESLRQYADILENSNDFENDLHELIKSVIAKHKRIIFNGNGYDDAWIEEAGRQLCKSCIGFR